MIRISQDERDINQEIEDLKNEINDRLSVLSEDIDDDTLEKMRRIKVNLQEKSVNRSDDENLDNLNKLNTGLSFYQRFKQSFESDMDIDPGRLMGLSDGIFGMVMTLLVFGMALPEIKILTAGDFVAFLQSIAPTFGVTLVSFILVSSFWVYHHEFVKIKNLNMPYLWLNIFYLASISFIPFSTSIIGAYSHFFLAEVIFGINIMFTIFMFLLMFRYAYNREFLEVQPSQDEKKYIYNTFFIIMGMTVVINLLDFNVSGNFIYLFFLVPVISTVRDIRFKMKS